MNNVDLKIKDSTYDLAEKLLDTYYLEQLIEISSLDEIEVLAILLESGRLDLPDVMPL